MTAPEEEARAAVGYGVPREQVSEAARPYYDHLLADRAGRHRRDEKRRQPQAQRTEWRIGVGIAIGLLWAAVIIMQVTPLVHGYSLPQANHICNSTLGLIGQGVSAQAAGLCRAVGDWMDVKALILWLAIIGTLAVAIESIRRSGSRQVAPPTPPAPPGRDYGIWPKQ
jgi:hypothetical protein